MRRDSRGSALLVSLMVIVGLSLLGLGFVAISETESAIAKNQQNALQTQAIAEAGAKLAVEWFQDPTWGENTGGMPTNTGTVVATAIPAAGAIKTTRVITGYTGLYKPRTSAKLLDKPYRPGNDDRLFGDEQHADIIINANTGGQAMLDTFNSKLLASDGISATAADKLAGEVTEIRIYAPPIVGGTLIPATGGFWSGGQRYGVATIEVTAQQFQRPATHTGVLASHAVRLVVGELPLPIPAGPIQGNANVAFGGNFRVHWGMETATGSLSPSLNLSSLPWANAFERPHFEHGYEPGTTVALVIMTNGGTGYTSAPAVSFAGGGGAGAAGTAVITSGAVTSVTITNRGTGYNPQNPPTVSFAGGGGSGATGRVSVGAEVWPITGATYEDQDYFHEVLAKDFQDPFYGCRAVGDNTLDGVGPAYPNAAQLYPYVYTAQERSVSNPSYAFQWQDQNIYPLRKKVVFPTIVYDYWKRITQQGRGYRGIYYFTYDAGTSNFKKFNQGAALSVATWVNTKNSLGLGAGVYFFDTTTGVNPQTYPIGSAQRNALLTPALSWNSADFGALGAPTFLMQGFVYLNTASFGTTGQGNNGTTVQANFPGEPFRDVGYPYWCTSVSSPPAMNCPAANAWSDCSGIPCRSGAGDGVFSCQDLNGNGRCDVVVMQAPTWTSNDPGAVTHTSPYTMPNCGSGCSGSHTTYIVKPWKSVAQATTDYPAGPCTIPAATYDGTNALSTDCSEPHEPYLNIVYPDLPANNNGDPYNVVIGWEDPANQTYRPKRIDNAGNVIPCPSPANQDDCVSNAYDVDGAVVPLPVILQGILYDEGQWGSEGNAWFYGSVLVNDTINLSSGTADVWFDEKLLKGTWAPPGMPRVIVFSESTDESTR
jgi:hypothetical protein